jgi:hypothetical protein
MWTDDRTLKVILGYLLELNSRLKVVFPCIRALASVLPTSD